MSKTYRIVVDVVADESDRLLHTEAVREGVAALIHEFYGVDGASLAGWGEVSALITSIRVDGREFDPTSQTLEATPINADISQMIWEGRTIQAIKQLRADNEGMSLMEAKDLVDKWRANH